MTFYIKKNTSTKSFSLSDEQGKEVESVIDFLRSVEIRGLSQRTLRAYAYDLLALYRWLAKAELSIEALSHPDLLDFIATQQEQGASPRTINRRLSTIRAYYHFVTGKKFKPQKGITLPPTYYKGPGRDRQLGLFNLKKPAHRVLQVKVPRTLIQPLSAEQVREFIGTLRRYRDLSIVYLMLLCGLRSHEVIAITLEDISLHEAKLRVRGKGSIDRMLPLPNMLITAVRNYLRLERPPKISSNLLFLVLQGSRRGQPMTLPGLKSLFRHRRKNPQLANANPHKWRHTFGTDMARSGVTLSALQKMMGHSDPTMTLHYINLSMADITEEFNRAMGELEKRYKTHQ